MQDLTSFAAQFPLLLLVACFGLGLIIGSFLNVVILRLPRILQYQWQEQCKEFQAESEHEPEKPPGLALDRSHCPQCGHGITALENIPVFSYLFLKGRCSSCSHPISAQYPFIELMTGIFTLAVFYQLGLSWPALFAAILTWTLIAMSGIDFHKQLLPDNLTLPMLWLGLLINTQSTFTDPVSAIIGAAAGYLSLWCVFHVFRLVTGKRGMGYGDFKLLAVFGAWLGWQMLPMIILLSSLVGALVGIGLIIFRGRDRNIPIPFGPYLAMAGWIAMLWGEPLLNGYLQITGLAN